MKKKKRLATQKRADQPDAMSRFSLPRLRRHLPLTFPLDDRLNKSPKPRYRSEYHYLCYKGLLHRDALVNFSDFDITVRLFDFSNLEPLLAAHLYRPSAKGQIPFHPVSMYLLTLYRRDHNLSRHEALRQLRDHRQGSALRRLMGFSSDLPSESGLRYYEKQLGPAAQLEINALQVDALYQANLLPTCPENEMKVSISFDGMLHKARSRMQCAHVKNSCYQPAPRPCPARQKDKRGCACQDTACAKQCRFAPVRDPEARLVAYTGNNKYKHLNPNGRENCDGQSNRKKRPSRLVYGYYSYAGQLLDEKLATYWMLPAAFGPANQGDRRRFPENFTYLRRRFPWLQIEAVMADAGAGYKNCLDLIWDAGALRMVDIVSSPSDKNPAAKLMRGYDEKGYPFCPFGYVLHSNGYDYQRRQTKWRCSKSCLLKPENERPVCDYQNEKCKHGFTVSVGRTHADGRGRLAREIPYGSDRWKELYHRRNCAESRNSVLERLGLKRMPVHGLPHSHVVVLQAGFIANQHTLVRLIREASSLLPTG